MTLPILDRPLKTVGAKPMPFDPVLAEELTQWYSQGGSLSRFHERNPGRISTSTLYKWLDEYPEFAANIARARDEGVDALVDRMMDVVEDLPKEPTVGEVKRAELELKTIQWLAIKMKPLKYGDKLALEHSGNIGLALTDQMLDAKIGRYLKLAKGEEMKVIEHEPQAPVVSDDPQGVVVDDAK